MDLGNDAINVSTVYMLLMVMPFDFFIAELQRSFGRLLQVFSILFIERNPSVVHEKDCTELENLSLLIAFQYWGASDL